MSFFLYTFGIKLLKHGLVGEMLTLCRLFFLFKKGQVCEKVTFPCVLAIHV